MILPWMLYATLTAAFLGLAAAVLERVIRQRGGAVRWIWVGALAGTVALPILTAFVLPEFQATSREESAAIAPATPAETAEPDTWFPLVDPIAATVPPSLRIDAWLLALWGIGSAGFVAYLAVSFRGLLIRRQGWVLKQWRGHDVWVSPDTGPAVIGFLRSTIVIPQWVLERRPEDQDLVLVHEAEHVQSGDARLLLGPLILLATAPWNLGLWWQWKRLREAIEIDCDLRVLARGINPSSYSRLLIDVAEQGNVHHWVLAELSESPSFLRKRIKIISSSSPRYWELRAVGSILLSAILILAACSTELPSSRNLAAEQAVITLESGGEVPISALPAGYRAPPLMPSDRTNHDAVRAAIQQYYPEVRSGEAEGDRHYVMFITNSRGEVEHSHLVENPPLTFQIGSNMDDLDEWFPGVDWKSARPTWLVDGGHGVERYPPPLMGSDTVWVEYLERQIPGDPVGPHLFRARR